MTTDQKRKPMDFPDTLLERIWREEGGAWPLEDEDRPKDIAEMTHLPHGEYESVLDDEKVGESRWTIEYKLVFRTPTDQPGEAWETTYSAGTGEQEIEPFDRHSDLNKRVTCYPVREKEVIVKQWVADK